MRKHTILKFLSGTIELEAKTDYSIRTGLHSRFHLKSQTSKEVREDVRLKISDILDLRNPEG